MTMVQDGASSSHLAGQADQGPARTKRYLGLLLGLVVLIGLYITSRYSYLLFHSLAELFSIVVAGGMFMVVWNARRFMDNNYLLFIAVAYLFVAGLDFIHMLAYKGMGVFTGSGGNLSTQLWIAARSLQAVSLLIAPFLLGRHINLRLVAAAYAVVFSLVLAAVFWWDVFPVCFVEGQGLTWFKVISEYVISAMLIGALVALYFRRGHFERRVWGLLAASIILTIGSELAFTFYISVYGFSNTMGHFFKIVAFYLVYRAIIQTGLEEPYGLMFRELEQSQEAIQEKEQQIRLILSSTAEGIYGLDLQGNCTFCNPAGLRMLGYDSEAEFLGQNMHDLAHHTRPDGTPYPEKECTIYRAFKERRGTHVDDEVLWRKDGTSFPAEYWSYPIWQDDQVVGSVVTFLDITHRKQAEEALRESTKELDIRNRIARIFLTVPDEEMYGEVLQVVLEDTQSKYGVFGYIDERGDLVVPTMAMGAWDECPVSDKRIVFPHETWGDSSWPRAIREGKVIYSNQRSTLTPERHIPIDRHISMPIIHRGRVVGLFQMANKPTDYNEKDLTLLQTVTDHVAPILDARLRSERKERERQRVEDALSQSEAGLAKAQEIAHLGNWDWNIVTNESLWSDEAYRIFGLRPQEIRVTYEAFLAMIHPDDREAVRHAVKRALSLPDSTYSVEYRVRRPDGSECFVHELGNVTFDDDGRPVRILGIVQDVTEHKQVEAALHLARETAEAATQAKSKFLASMSHELRTPLNAIIGFSEILEDRTFGPINEKQARYVGHVLSSGRHLLDLINDILDLSKVEAGKMELEPSEVDLTALLEGSLVMIKEKALTHGISLELDVADDLSGLRVWADERKLKQVMFNLLSNAAKFTPDHGAIKVRAWRDREEFFCSVSDTGIGLEAEDLERVFGAFEQVDSSYARDQQGTGLGLALSKRMAELHGGRIWAESAGPDQGSTFILSLPIRPSAKKGASATSPAAADETGGQGIETTSANEADTRPRILVVEDNLPAQELLVRHLADIGFAVHCALDGEEAIYKARELKPVAITLDILLPDKNGLDVLRELKALPETKDIPVLVISITDDGPKALSLGAAGYIRKPVTKRELIKAVAAMVPGAARKG